MLTESVVQKYSKSSSFASLAVSLNAPKMMDEAEIETVIKEVLAELEIAEPTAKDKGKIMKVLMPKVKGKADGKLVNQVLGGMFK